MKSNLNINFMVYIRTNTKLNLNTNYLVYKVILKTNKTKYICKMDEYLYHEYINIVF